jgi:5-methylthioadenosine/S-adenosylhomocysteine deaminase
MKILIRDCTALTLADPPLREHVSLVIEDGHIREIRQEPQQWSASSFDHILSGSGKLVTPGFVNAHTHLAMVLLRGYADDMPLQRWLEEAIWPTEKKLTAEDVYWGSLLGIAEMIRSGTTAFADMYFHMDSVARAVEESGMRALLEYGLIAPEPGERVERELRTAREFIEQFHGSAAGRIRASVGPHAPYTCHPDLWEGALDLAKKHQLMIHTHLAETKKEVDDARQQWGKTPVEYLENLGGFEVPMLAAHCVHLSERDIEILAEHRVNVAHNPGSNLKLASGFAPVTRLLEAGVNVALGTDGASANNNLDMLEEIRLASFLQKGILEDATALPAPVALRLGTLSGARALGLAGESGTIEPGKRADLIMLYVEGPHWVPDYDPISNLVYAARSADVSTVIIDGRLVMQDRQILTFDEAEVIERVKRLQRQYARDRGGR